MCESLHGKPKKSQDDLADLLSRMSLPLKISFALSCVSILGMFCAWPLHSFTVFYFFLVMFGLSALVSVGLVAHNEFPIPGTSVWKKAFIIVVFSFAALWNIVTAGLSPVIKAWFNGKNKTVIESTIRENRTIAYAQIMDEKTGQPVAGGGLCFRFENGDTVRYPIDEFGRVFAPKIPAGDETFQYWVEYLEYSTPWEAITASTIPDPWIILVVR